MDEFGLTFSAMACDCEVRLHAPDAAQAQAWAQRAIDEVRRIEAKYSRYRDDSVTARINAAAGREAIEIDEETAALVDFGAALYAQSARAFDLTSGVLRRAWDFARATVPTQDAVEALLPLVGWQQVQWRRPHLQLPKAGMQIDFGGIGKEYAADRAAAALRAAGASAGFVNLGGDVRAIGARDVPWRIGIQHPRAAAGTLIGSIDCVDGAVATSGDYERYFECDGRRYCHLLDARTGWPVAFWQSVSVAAPVCAAAGACSTLAMLMPVDAALAFLAAQRVEYLAVAADGSVHRSR